MDATSAVVVLLFIISIMGSFGSRPQPTTNPAAYDAAIYREITLNEPSSVYAAAPAEESAAAIKKYITRYQGEELASEITASLTRHAQKYDVNPKLVAALMARESRFNPKALSSSGAIGLGQLLPSTAKGMGIENPYDVNQNVEGTVRYVKYLLGRFNGKVSFALAGYLEGPNAVTRQGGFSAHTKSYVEDILKVCQQI
jgi:soluble lytic murein transglycosylase-like protein